MISEKDYNEIYLKGYEDGKNDNNNLKINYEIKPSFTTRKIKELQQENQKYKEVIDKAINNSQYWIDYYTKLNGDERIALRLQENIDILKEVE